MRPDDRATDALSRREIQVIDRLARGDYDKEVAFRLGIQLGTVRTYRKRLMAKLGVDGVVQAALVAWRLGYLDLESIADEALAKRGLARGPIPRQAVAPETQRREE